MPLPFCWPALDSRLWGGIKIGRMKRDSTGQESQSTPLKVRILKIRLTYVLHSKPSSGLSSWRLLFISLLELKHFLWCLYSNLIGQFKNLLLHVMNGRSIESTLLSMQRSANTCRFDNWIMPVEQVCWSLQMPAISKTAPWTTVVSPFYLKV